MRSNRWPLALLLVFLGLPAAAAAQASSVAELKFPPLPETRLPKPQRVVLDNGMVVMLLEDHELPLVEVTALVHTGSIFEPAAKAGLARLMGTVLRTGGTARMSGDEVDTFLEGRAATVETSVAEDLGITTLSSLKKDFPDVLRVFADVLRRPVFNAAKLELARNAAVAEVARQNEDAQDIMFREFDEIVFGAASPYARAETFASLAAIGRDDLVAWHARYFHPERVVLGLVGDFDSAQALALVKEAFGDWPRGAAVEDPEPWLQAEVAPGFFFAEKSDLPQSTIAIGTLGIRKDSPDLYAVDVMNQVLSGSFASRLLSNVRTKKGLGYVVFGGVNNSWKRPGTTQLVLTTKAETTAAGVQALIEEARNMTAEPPTDAEVERAKQAILNSFVFTQDSLKKILLRQQVPLEYYGYPLDWLEHYRAGIEAVTTAEVRQAAAKYLRPEKFAVLVVGPALGREQLATLGTVTPVDIRIPGAPQKPPAPR